MRYPAIAALSIAAAVGAAYPGVAPAQAPLMRAMVKHVAQPEFDAATFRYQCPTGHIPTVFSFTPRMPYEQWVENDRSLVDRNGVKQNRNTLTSASQIDGGGLSLSIYNIDCHLKEWVGSVNCLSTAASSDNTLTLVKASVQTAAKATGSPMAFCPADSPVALGGFSNADGTVLQDTTSA